MAFSSAAMPQTSVMCSEKLRGGCRPGQKQEPVRRQPLDKKMRPA